MSRSVLRPFDGELRRLVRRASVIDAVPSGAKERIWTRVEAVGGAPDEGDENGRGSSGGPAERGGVTGVSARTQVLALLAAFAVGGVVGALAMRRWGPVPSPIERVRLVYVDRPVVGSAPGRVEGPRVTEAPGPGPSASSAGAVHEAVAPPRAGVPHASLASERELLDAARAALAREDGADALQATARHEREYPDGVFVQEREAIAVRALLLLNRAAEARARVDRFQARFPDSLLLPTLEAAARASPVP